MPRAAVNVISVAATIAAASNIARVHLGRVAKNGLRVENNFARGNARVWRLFAHYEPTPRHHLPVLVVIPRILGQQREVVQMSHPSTHLNSTSSAKEGHQPIHLSLTNRDFRCV